MDIKAILSDIEAAHSGHVERKRGSSHSAIAQFRRAHPRVPNKFGEFQSRTTEMEAAREKATSKSFPTKFEREYDENHCTLKIMSRSHLEKKNPQIYYNAIVKKAKQRLDDFLSTNNGKKILQQVENCTRELLSFNLSIHAREQHNIQCKCTNAVQHTQSWTHRYLHMQQESLLHGSEQAAKASILTYLEQQICKTIAAHV